MNKNFNFGDFIRSLFWAFILASIIMIIVIVIIFLSVANVKAQTGGNGINYFKYATTADISELIEASGDTLEFRFRADNDESIVPLIVLNDSIKAHGKAMKVFYCAKPDTVNQGDIMALFVNDIPFVIELGNERYSQKLGNTFASYIAEYQPLIDWVNSLNLGIRFAVCLSPRPTGFPASRSQNSRSDTWNADAKAYLASRPNWGVVWHQYYNSNDYTGLAVAPSGIAWNSSAPDTRIQEFYNGLLSSSWYGLPLAVNDYLGANFAGHEWYMTEFGALPAQDESLDGEGGCGDIKNTLAYSCIVFAWWHVQSPYFNAMCIHSMESEVGMLSPAKKYDASHGNIKRMEYYAFKLFNETGALLPYHGMTIATAGTHRYYFAGFNSEPVITYSGVKLVSKTYHYIGGQPWTSSGSCKWMGDGSQLVDEISGITVGDTIPFVGFGYVEIVTEKIPTKSCNKKWPFRWMCR